MVGMKLSVSIPDDEVTFLDEYAATHEVPSRSAVVRRALNLLRAAELEHAYVAAFDQWSDEDAEVWDAVIADGIA